MSCAHARLILLRRQRFWHASTADPGLTLEWPAFGSACSCYFSAPGARPPSLTRALGSRALRLASRPLPSTTRGRAVARPLRAVGGGGASMRRSVVPDTCACAKAADCPDAVQVSLAAQRQPCAVHRVPGGGSPQPCGGSVR